eukprot:9949962-Ditylum_brightwellii.AAC.1
MKSASSAVNKLSSKKIYMSDDFDSEPDRPKYALERKRLENMARNVNILEGSNNKTANLKHKSDGIQVQEKNSDNDSIDDSIQSIGSHNDNSKEPPDDDKCSICHDKFESSISYNEETDAKYYQDNFYLSGSNCADCNAKFVWNGNNKEGKTFYPSQTKPAYTCINTNCGHM